MQFHATLHETCTDDFQLLLWHTGRFSEGFVCRCTSHHSGSVSLCGETQLITSANLVTFSVGVLTFFKLDARGGGNNRNTFGAPYLSNMRAQAALEWALSSFASPKIFTDKKQDKPKYSLQRKIENSFFFFFFFDMKISQRSIHLVLNSQHSHRAEQSLFPWQEVTNKVRSN